MFSDLKLNDRMLKALGELGFETPTPVQEKTIPLALAGKDLQVGAETGSGKTAAFLLPTIQRFHEQPAPRSGTRALVLVPTRELAQQVNKQVALLARYTYIKSDVITGGDSFKFQAASLRKNPDIVVATPGRLLEHLERGTANLQDLEVLVLDEADRMLDMGFSDDVLTIAGYCKPERQTLLFSATMEQRGLKVVIDKVLNQPEHINLGNAKDRQGTITQQLVLADDLAHKEKLLAWLLNNETYTQAIVFTNTRVQADKLGGWLRYHKLKAGTLHGDMTQDERNQVMGYLREGRINVLVATDVAARGIDIKNIELVINLDMARSGDDYIHRIGRTGRAGEQGLAISLITSPEWNLMASIERYLKVKFERRSIKGLEGSYKGPKKLKASGKAATRRKKPAVKGKKQAEQAGKQRHRDKKNIGKRRSPANKRESAQGVETGFEPLKKKK